MSEGKMWPKRDADEQWEVGGEAAADSERRESKKPLHPTIRPVSQWAHRVVAACSRTDTVYASSTCCISFHCCG